MRALALSMLAAAAVLGLSCSSGQTGSPDCPVVTTCACRSLYGREVFRGHVVAFEEAMVEIELEELYSPSSSPVLVPGARGTFRYSIGPSHCADPDPIPALHGGDTVLAALDLWAGEMWLVPWTDPLDLGDRQVPLDTLPERADSSTCDADLEPPPCDDTVESTCAMGRGRGGGSVGSVLAVLAVLAALRLSRRRGLGLRTKTRLNPRPALR